MRSSHSLAIKFQGEVTTALLCKRAQGRAILRLDQKSR